MSGRVALGLRFRGDGGKELGTVVFFESVPTLARKLGPKASEERMIDTRPCVYVLASQRNGTLYVGVTGDIARRAFEHREGAISGFTRRYGVHLLVFFEFHETMADAVLRERRIKKWRRAWKLALIERDNPDWRDLYDDLML